ncbi:MAG: hemerythrin domain-containing protein [Myxococcales bacterium]|jgi:hemerythrin superfamily protein|nr:hemerythrin domain-containing protein [Myxococcales bacterium]
MNAIDLLLAQHREIENLFGQCKKASGEDKLELFHAIADLLVLHTSIEEEHFYPAAATGGIPEAQVREALEEHLLVKRSLADLLAQDAVDAEFDAKLQVLEELVAHHVKEEEDELFPAVESKLSKTRLRELGAALESMTTELEEEEALYERVQDVDELARAAPFSQEEPRPRS